MLGKLSFEVESIQARTPCSVNVERMAEVIGARSTYRPSPCQFESGRPLQSYTEASEQARS